MTNRSDDPLLLAADAATAAGAERVGMEDLAEDMKAGNINYDVIIASPDAMRVVGPLGLSLIHLSEPTRPY